MTIRALSSKGETHYLFLVISLSPLKLLSNIIYLNLAIELFTTPSIVTLPNIS